MPQVSVISTFYNYAKFAPDLLNSVQTQSFKDFECIIVDDCSTDHLDRIVKPYLTDMRFSYIRFNENKGYSCAKNAGLMKSSGDYIVIIDGDDMLSEHSLLKRIKYFHKNPECQWLHAKAYEFGINKPYDFTYKKRPFIKRFESMKKSGVYKDLWNCLHAQTIMTRRSVYEKVGLYEESMRSSADKEMWARLINNVGVPKYLDEFVSCYRIHNNQMHKSREKLKRIDKIKKTLSTFIEKRKFGDFTGIKKINGEFF